MPKKAIEESISFLDLEKELSQSEFEFGEYLRTVRKACGISVRKLADSVDKTPTYISDIEKGNNKPPDKELLEKIIDCLNVKNKSKKITNSLFDLAGQGRKSVSADIAEYIMANGEIREILRDIIQKPNSNEILNQVKKMIR